MAVYLTYTFSYIIKDFRQIKKRIEKLEAQQPKKKLSKAEIEEYETSLVENGWVKQGVMWSRPNKDNEI